ncbi:MAG: T9SS type A sorting domain-containing protein [Bacteroidia bacterium]|nr:T9SS type A sorting domain-containing protein [Bacteroidia bacterium]
MKNHFLLFALALVFFFSSNAQVTQLNESFTAPFSPASSGWFVQNNSNPIGTMTWAQGIGTIFPAYSGSSNDYYQANFNSQGNTFGNISNFLITPTVSLMNGGVLKFATRTAANPSTYPDRLEVRMSIGTGTGSIPVSSSAVGTFTALLTTINPNLTNSGYPGVWTVYTMSLSGITGTVAGRFAFRYEVYDGGPNGANSDYIGLDNVEYTTGGPCPQAPVTITPNTATICTGGGGLTLVAGGASTYTWNNGSHNTSLYAAPFSTTVYTLSGSSSSTCPGYATATVFVVPPPNISAPNVTACPGGNATLTAFGATTYTWSNGATGSTIVVPVNSSTFFVVQGSTAPGCPDDFAQVFVTTNTFLIVSDESPVACPNQTFILGASGALSYTWSTGANSPSIVITPTGNATYYVSGFDGNCNETKYIGVSVDPNLFAPSFTTCAGTSATLFVSGANSYSWSNGSTSSVVVVTPSSNTVYTVTGTSGNCSASKTVSVSLGNKLSVNCSQVCLGSSVLLSAYGASSYTWYPILDFNASVILTPTASMVYTLAGVSGTCSGSRTIQVTYCAGFDQELSQEDNIRVYPNPFNDELSVSGAEGHLRICNLFGQVVYEERLEGETKISTYSLNPGIYFVILTRPESTQRKVIKVIKN